MGGTKMMGVQLDRGPNFGLHRGTWGTQNGGDDQKLGGTKMMGVQLGGGPNYGLHRGTWGTQNRGGTKNWGEPK